MVSATGCRSNAGTDMREESARISRFRPGIQGTPVKMPRCIFHVDMDAFYASVEQRDHPEYRNRPVIVGADPRKGEGRGVVAACSYEARQFGIHSALPISQAYRRCPNGIYLRPDMSKYRQVSGRLREIFFKLTDRVEPLSIDEAFLDVSEVITTDLEALQLARQLKGEIRRDHRLTASVGAGPSKFIAKIASDLRKPDGLLIVRPHEIHEFLDPLPISRLWGVGPRTEGRLNQLSIRTIRDLRNKEQGYLEERFGKQGNHLWRLANGIDERPVVTRREVKSIGQEKTFSTDTGDSTLLEDVLGKLSAKVATRLREKGLQARTVTIKIRYSDFTTLTRQASFRDPLDSVEEITRLALHLLREHRKSDLKLRLIGVSVSSLVSPPRIRQLRLF